jgi:hypothetical protein
LRRGIFGQSKEGGAMDQMTLEQIQKQMADIGRAIQAKETQMKRRGCNRCSQKTLQLLQRRQADLKMRLVKATKPM